MNKIQIKLSDINITDSFKEYIPNPKKIGKKLIYYKWNKKFDKPVVIDSKNELVDGYITYLIAKMLDVTEIDALKIS